MVDGPCTRMLERIECVKFLSWRTRLHICPSFFPVKERANFTHPYLAPFSGKVPVSSWVRGTGPFAMLGNRER